VYYDTTFSHVYKATQVLLMSSNVTGAVGFFLPLNLLTCLCIDLILMIRAPFKGKEVRMKWYYMYSYLCTFIIAFVGTIYPPDII